MTTSENFLYTKKLMNNLT